jgi:hypothetical protein
LRLRESDSGSEKDEVHVAFIPHCFRHAVVGMFAEVLDGPCTMIVVVRALDVCGLLMLVR